MLTAIRITEKESNKRGDLFGRSISDLFVALGYDDIRLNIHKSGREVDVEAEHRIENRKVIAECKATEEAIGGDDINKFIGVLDVEKRKHAEETIGYFISLSGFKQTAIEQEKEAGGKRVILLDGSQVIKELVDGRIIVSQEKAMERAGRCVAKQSNKLIAEDTCELLANEIGWIWAIYFAKNKQKTHFALIHADGEALAPTLAMKVVEADKLAGGILHTLSYLSPEAEIVSNDLVNQAKEKYFAYLSKECGEITLGGLPADQEVGSRKLSLEHIFVPLYLEKLKSEETDSSEDSESKERKNSDRRKLIGKVFSNCSHLAILADPGGGKTTLLKRVAIAYSFPERRKFISDALPDQNWFPLFIRCRQLSHLSISSILDILSLIPNWAEMNESAKPFSILLNQALRDGEALLLIDGLDEISDEGERISFIKQLRVFLSTYPAVGIIITSREAGFRIIGGTLSSYCEHYKIADFDNDDITRLTLAWHREVVGNQQKVRLEAEKLAKTICETERVRTLAKNPLLLTTLLLVKRWVGQLPSRRSVLYGKAIEVLLMTWNVEGYDPIEQDEAIPQLAFIAFEMMKEGVQRISAKRLKDLLILARKQMPDVLGYARIGVSEFVNLVELRSSILIFSGHTVEQGTLYPMYEFRHLTFQEYLTARAIVDGYYPDRKEGDAILPILRPHIGDSSWREVVPLVAILAGRKAQPLIEYLIERCKELKPYESPKLPDKQNSPVNLLAQCFLDEVQVSPDLIEKGLEWIAKKSPGPSSSIRDLYHGKYGDVLFKVVQNAFFKNFDEDCVDLGGTLGQITLEQIEWNNVFETQKVERILDLLKSDSLVERASGALAVMLIAFYTHNFAVSQGTIGDSKEGFEKMGNAVVPLLYTEQPQLQLAACWAFAWLGENNLWSPKNCPAVLPRLLATWRGTKEPDIQYVASWAIAELPIIERRVSPFSRSDQELTKAIQAWHLKKEEPFTPEREMKKASIIIAYYLKQPWSDKDLSKFISEVVRSRHHRSDWRNGTLMLQEIANSGQTSIKNH